MLAAAFLAANFFGAAFFVVVGCALAAFANRQRISIRTDTSHLSLLVLAAMLLVHLGGKLALYSVRESRLSLWRGFRSTRGGRRTRTSPASTGPGSFRLGTQIAVPGIEILWPD